MRESFNIDFFNYTNNLHKIIKFKEERGRLPELTSADPWEKRMAEGIEYLRQKVKKEKQ